MIAKINGVEISAVVENGEYFLPIKPICEAIGVKYSTQLDKIRQDETLCSTVPLRGIVAADGKTREMVVMPLKYIYGWLFTINPANVAPEAKQKVIEYRRECYEVLYEHFSRSSRRRVEENEAEIKQLQIINEALAKQRELKATIRTAESELAKIRASRLDDQPSLF